MTENKVTYTRKEIKKLLDLKSDTAIIRLENTGRLHRLPDFLAPLKYPQEEVLAIAGISNPVNDNINLDDYKAENW